LCGALDFDAVACRLLFMLLLPMKDGGWCFKEELLVSEVFDLDCNLKFFFGFCVLCLDLEMNALDNWVAISLCFFPLREEFSIVVRI
jgi:hypothetical protein